MAEYLRKPSVDQAIQYTGHNGQEVAQSLGLKGPLVPDALRRISLAGQYGSVDVYPGDWIVLRTDGSGFIIFDSQNFAHWYAPTPPTDDGPLCPWDASWTAIYELMVMERKRLDPVSFSRLAGRVRMLTEFESIDQLIRSAEEYRQFERERAERALTELAQEAQEEGDYFG